LTEITRKEVEDWVIWAENCPKTVQRRDNQGGEVGYSNKTVLGWWNVLKIVLRDAAAHYDLKDPLARVQPPKRDGGVKRERRTLTTDQLKRMLESLEQRHPQHYAAGLLLASTGMRSGEVFGLHWEDVDLEGRVIRIQRAVWRGRLDTPKTEAGRREVPITAQLAKVLRDHRRQQLMGQHPGLEVGIVFPSITGGYRCGLALRRPLELAAQDVGVKLHVTPQVLRRTFNTLALLAGVDRVVLRSVMGHTDESMTEHYAGVGLESKRAALEGVFR
jgi:integrase